MPRRSLRQWKPEKFCRVRGRAWHSRLSHRDMLLGPIQHEGTSPAGGTVPRAGCQRTATVRTCPVVTRDEEEEEMTIPTTADHH